METQKPLTRFLAPEPAPLLPDGWKIVGIDTPAEPCPGVVNRPLREGLPPLPARIAALPVGPNGYPVPWFVPWINGVPEFRAAAADKRNEALVGAKCWVCGSELGTYRTFVIGPMCSVNRVTAEPPSHYECAVFSAQSCPFLTKPQMVRRDHENMAEKLGCQKSPGMPIDRNPGVCCLWTTKTHKHKGVEYAGYIPFPVENGFLIRLGDPQSVEWFCEGRKATRAEVDRSIESGIPILEEVCTTDEEKAELAKAVNAARTYLPSMEPRGAA